MGPAARPRARRSRASPRSTRSCAPSGSPGSRALVAAAAIAAGPITVTYSTRVKEYSADLLLACLVLWLRRAVAAPRRRARGLALLGVASVAAMWISASTAAVVGGAAACVLCVAWSRRDAATRCGRARRRARRRRRARCGRSSCAASPPSCGSNWRTHGFLFGYSDAHHVAFAFQQTFSGLAHGLLGLPIPYTFQGDTLRASR